MASNVPPRRESLGNIFSEMKKQSSLDTLTAMGFPKSRAEKSLAATGNKGVNVASNWLLSHVNDPTLDVHDPRDYIIYLFPTGDFREQLQKMRQDSLDECGWNAAHIYDPHITLCSFFRMSDSNIEVLDRISSLISDTVKEWPSLNYHIGLDLHTENNSFIGYFVTRDVHKLVDDMMIRVQREFQSIGIEMEPQKKQLHMTLAFQYNPDHQEKLMKMARNLTLPRDATWEIRIYSRLHLLRNSEVRYILKRYQAVQADELELNLDDYVYMDPDEHRKSMDGWFKGTLHSTGASGFFPGIFTQKTSQMDIWTLHRSIKLFPSKSRLHSNGFEYMPNGTAVAEAAAAPATTETTAATAIATTTTTTTTTTTVTEDLYDNPAIVVKQTADGYAVVNKKGPKSPTPHKPRKLFVVRHAQRCDFSFKSWFERSFDKQGNYRRFDLNCPSFLWPRKSVHDYAKDCPLTEIGKAQARITGEGLRDAGETIEIVYSSCALRCVMTAQEIIKGVGASCKIRVEPALFEWCGWCRNVMPEFMTLEELVQAGFDVDLSYTPLMKTTMLNLQESIGSYYSRSYKATGQILRRHKEDGGNVLLVGHSGSMDACTRQLRGKPAYTTDGQLRDVVRGIPYCFLSCSTEDASSGLLTLCEPPVPILSHGMNKEYDWRSMIN